MCWSNESVSQSKNLYRFLRCRRNERTSATRLPFVWPPPDWSRNGEFPINNFIYVYFYRIATNATQADEQYSFAHYLARLTLALSLLARAFGIPVLHSSLAHYLINGISKM